MNIIFSKQSGLVSGFSDDKIETSEEQINLHLTTEEETKLRSNLYDIFVEKDKLKFVLNDRGKEQSKTDEMKTIIAKVQQGTQTKKELANLLTKIINK